MDNGISYVPEDRLTQGLFLATGEQEYGDRSILSLLTNWALLTTTRPTMKWAFGWTHYGMCIIALRCVENPIWGNHKSGFEMAGYVTSFFILNRPTVGVDVGAKRLSINLLGNWLLKGLEFFLFR